MSALNDYKSWHEHYLSMVNGQIVPNQKVYVVDSKQSGSGKIQIVSPSQQKDQMARASLKPKKKVAQRGRVSIKAKPKKKVVQKRLKRRSVKTKARNITKKTQKKRKR